MARTEARARVSAILGVDVSAHDVCSFDALKTLEDMADNLRGRIACHGATAAIRAECWRFANRARIEAPRAASAFAALAGVKECWPLNYNFNDLSALVSATMQSAFEAITAEVSA